jgi:alkylation response protein AidB-like acyl-CoA dehydrogenase
VLIDGEAEVNEVFFDNVLVPAENLVGEENKGWTYAKYLLTHERTNIAGVGFSDAALATLKHVAAQTMTGGRPLDQNPHFAARMAQVEIDLMAMRTTNLRMISAAAKGQAPGVESSMLKVKGTLLRQELSALLRRAVGPDAMPYLPDFLDGGDNADPLGPDHAPAAAPGYFNMRKLSIFGGSNEVQRTIIAKSALGL